MNTYHILIFTFSSLLSIGYLNFCTSDNDFETDGSPKIWPNISEDHGFLQWPGLTGAGGLDFSFYDAFAEAVNASRYIPYKLISKSNFTILQIAIMGAVGALACGAASILAESAYFHNLDKHHHHHHGRRRRDVNDHDFDDSLPHQLESGETFELPAAIKSSNEHPSARSPKRYNRYHHRSSKYRNNGLPAPLRAFHNGVWKSPLPYWYRLGSRSPSRSYNARKSHRFPLRHRIGGFDHKQIRKGKVLAKFAKT